MDAISLLEKDHRTVETPFPRFSAGGGLTGVVKRLTGNAASPHERRATALRICDELETHARIEEEVFYPAVRALDDETLRPRVSESLDEHATIKERVAAVRAALEQDDELRA